MANRDTARTLVIGIGNPDRGDDGVGPLVVELLRERKNRRLMFLDHHGEGTALIEAWDGSAAVFLVDAVRSGAALGAIHRIDARVRPVPVQIFHTSSHAFNVAEAIELARVLNRLPPRLVVYGVEGRRFDVGAGMSPEVARATDDVVERLFNEVGAGFKPAPTDS
jgi:hydrogenase maturation protease